MTARAVEQSLWPDVKPDRPTGPLLGSVIVGTNADLIAKIAPLYLEGHTVMDVTYGRGAWWGRYEPPGLICHDLDLDGIDFCELPEDDRSVDVVCFDPPYVPAGGYASSNGEYRQRYGLKPMSQRGLIELITAGMSECARVARRWVLAKCCDYTNAGQFHLGHLDMIAAAEAAGLGGTWDFIVHHTGPGPGGHNVVTPLRARRHHSYMVVFDASKGDTTS